MTTMTAETTTTTTMAETTTIMTMADGGDDGDDHMDCDVEVDWSRALSCLSAKALFSYTRFKSLRENAYYEEVEVARAHASYAYIKRATIYYSLKANSAES